MKLLKVLVIFLIFICIYSIFTRNKAYAFITKTGNTVDIAKNETVDNSIFVGGQDIRVDGNVNGDIICIGQTITITGNVNGDIICIGQTITITGAINGNVRIAGQEINLSGQIARNATLFGQNINSMASIAGEMYVGGQTFSMNGLIRKDLQGSIEVAKINGEIERNVNLNVGDLLIDKNAKINGGLTYRAKNEARIANGTIAGKITRNYPPQNEYQKREVRSRNWWIFSRIVSIITYLLIALLFIVIWPRAMIQVSTTMISHMGKSIGIGAIILFITPIVIFILMLTIVGIPIAFLLGIAYFFAVFMSRVVVGIVIGNLIVQNYGTSQRKSLIWASIIGTVITGIFYSIPLIGLIASFIGILWGLGGVYHLINPPVSVIHKK